MIWEVKNDWFREILEADTKEEAEAKFLRIHYPTKLDDDLPDLNIEVEVKNGS